MSIIFTIIGLTILGLFVRAIFKDKTIADKPKSGYELVIQLVISLILGAIIWAVVPERCKRGSDDGYNYIEHGRISRD